MRTHTTAALLAITGLLALPAGALAGGWATVGLSSTPDGLAPGATWNVEIEVLQHGRTPLQDIHPTVSITAADDERPRTFTTRPTGKPGVYRAAVRFPRAGTWRYVVDDGFTARHPYPPVQIGAGGGGAGVAAGAARDRSGGDGGGLAFDRIGLALLAAIAAAGLTLAPARLRERRAARPAAAPGG
jgi:hypothetical protein